MAAKSRKRRHGEVATLGSLLLSSLSREQARMMQMADLCSRWSEAVGDKIGGKSSPESLLDGVLTIVAATPPCAQEIGMRGGDIASLVREKWSLEVLSVRVRVGKPKTVRKTRGSGRKCSPVKPDPKEIAACRERIEELVPRDDIAEGLARLMAQYRKRFGEKDR
ncbi:MAG: DciA family protein [Thermovirgaceae bacterium]|nr:DciA family protein [Thermovirgaceae bacterium]